MEMGDLFLGPFARCCSIKHVLPSFIDGTDSGFDDSVDSVCSWQNERPGLADCWMLRKLGMSNIPLLHSLCILFYSYCATLAQLSPSYLGIWTATRCVSGGKTAGWRGHGQEPQGSRAGINMRMY
ncbi:hypothetical protein VFPPC_16525 [Pochonia chlamydosporia 170]|uniref:Uncharacterized protein n=1 Tax=Pochonia chlamydosporia 170 TaxID=1380566 RepID=A0A179F8D9_METCM|nr:hypothetical protein VFPPC_16525 [Pochonia chlamydosporia 170]OAQ61541.1 hypothetical protein VFPPC_16525 [Pochonia chlamydosporia 170]